MRRTFVFLMALLLCGGLVAAQQADKASEKAAEKPTVGPPLSQVQGLLRVTAEPDSGLASRPLIEGLLRNERLIEDAIKIVLNQAVKDVPPETVARTAASARDAVFVYVVQPAESQDRPAPGIVLLHVGAQSNDERVPAGKLLESLGKALEERLASLDTKYRQGQIRESQLPRLLKELDLRIQSHREALWHLANLHKVSLDPELDIREKARLDSEWQAMDVQAQSLKAREEALQKLIDELQASHAKIRANDEVARQLEMSIQTRRRILGVLKAQAKAQVTTQEKILQAEDEVARAQAELARHRQEMAGAAEGERIAELQRRMQDTAVEMAELNAKRQIIEKLRVSAPGNFSDVSRTRLEVELMEHTYRERAAELDQLQTKRRLYAPPVVDVIPVK